MKTLAIMEECHIVSTIELLWGFGAAGEHEEFCHLYTDI